MNSSYRRGTHAPYQVTVRSVVSIIVMWILSSMKVSTRAFILPRGSTGCGLLTSQHCKSTNFPTAVGMRQPLFRSLGGILMFSSKGTPTTNATSKAPTVEISPSNHGTRPLVSFKSGGNENGTQIDSRLLKMLVKDELITPTPIQAHAVPLLLRGQDLMASAQTGSGKTLMFALPLANRLLRQSHRSKAGHGSNNPKMATPSALILSPTRELAQQTASGLRRLVSQTPLQVRLATGGSNTKIQRRDMLAGCDILVGTPGRVIQFVDERCLRLTDRCVEVVVDEADRMLDLGFEIQLRRIARALGRWHHHHPQQQHREGERHTVLCSATFPPEVQRVASEFLRGSYYFVAAGRVGATHGNIAQKLHWVEGGQAERRKIVLEEVRRHHEAFLGSSKKNSEHEQDDARRVIVFANTKDEAERLGSALGSIKGGVRIVHGDKMQSERNKALAAFRDGRIFTLVATDVAARGIDIPGIGLVIQADAPRDVDSFVHRIGRTGRAGKQGRAIACLDGRSVSIAPELVRLLRDADQEVPTWLIGMSHVTTARIREEEDAVAAGGGAVLDESTPESLVKENPDEGQGFSGQDFRSNAAAGTWGAERDTSYRSFDEDAYMSLDKSSSSIEISDSIEKDTPESTAYDNGIIDVQELVSSQDAASDSYLDESLLRGGGSTDSLSTIDLMSCRGEREEPSEQLRNAMKRISGSDSPGEKPDDKLFAALSKRGENQRLRFEYLGLYPFSDVAGLLKPRGSLGRKEGRHSNMPQVLMVAEKPSIAKAIADALAGPNGPRQRKGISRALPVYEFTSDAFGPLQLNGNDRPARALVKVTSVVGHVFGLGFDNGKMDNQEGSVQGRNIVSDPCEYFRMPVVKQEESTTGKLRVVEHLRALAAASDHLVLWLDCDAEGENIAFEVIGVVRKALERNAAESQTTKLDAQQTRRIHRARFSAITKVALRDAFSNLKEPDPELSRSVDARQELDLRVGVALTRLLTWKCVGLARRHFSPTTRLVSYGPCQTPALSLCVDRAREIKSFVPEDYWKVHITASVPNSRKESVRLSWKVPSDDAVIGWRHSSGAQPDKVEDSATFNRRKAQELVNLASEHKSRVTVVRVNSLTEQMKPPLGLNTVALLSVGSKALGMSPKQVMTVAEKLYSGGFISYPRTETTRYDPNGFDVRTILREHSSHLDWGKSAAHLLRTKYAKSGRPPLRGHDAGDHPPITVLRPATREEVGGGAAWRVYEFVSRNFLGSLSDELSYIRRVAELRLENKAAPKVTHSFEFEQIEIENLGFAGACSWVLRDIGAAKRGDVIPLEEGMFFPITDAYVESCATKPPRFLQEHELIELMDKNRIGTDASMATHVSNIVDRGYVVLCDETGDPLRPPRPPIPGRPRPPRQIGRYLVPTPLGSGLIDLFGEIDDSEEYHADISTGQSTALLARPSIRAKMEEEVKQIALGKLSKEDVLAKNLQWFEARYKQFEESLRHRTSKFTSSLEPTKAALNSWRHLGAFEEAKENQTKMGKKHGKKGSVVEKKHKRSPRKSRFRGADKQRQPNETPRKGKFRGAEKQNANGRRKFAESA